MKRTNYKQNKTFVHKQKSKVTHSPLLLFRKRANCQKCPLHNSCLSDKTPELRCILALIADTQHNTMRLNTIRGLHQ